MNSPLLSSRAIAAASLALFVGVGSGCPGKTDGDDSSSETGEMEVVVETASGDPVADARLEAAGSTTTTDANGRAELEGLSAGKTVVRARADGYASSTATGDISAGSTSVVQIEMAEITLNQTFSAKDGGTFETRGVRIDIPGSAIVDADGNQVDGDVDLAVAAAGETGASDVVLPGPTDRIRSSNDDAPAMIVPERLASIELGQSGEPVEIAEGEAIEVAYALPESASERYSPGDTIDAYWYDEEAGEWVREGAGEVVESNGKLEVVAEIPHLTWWGMCKSVDDFDCLNVEVVDADGNPVPSAYVAANGLDTPARSTGWTNEEGRSCTQFLAGSSIRLEVLPPSRFSADRVTREVTGRNRGAACQREEGPSCRDISIQLDEGADPGDAGMVDTTTPDTGSDAADESDTGDDVARGVSHRLDSTSGHSCLVRSDGRVTCWGKNGRAADTNQPVDVGDIDSAAAVYAGDNSATCARTNDDTLYCWGPNGEGAVGNGSTDPVTSPTEILSGAVDADITGGRTCVVMGDGSGKCWGSNSSGALGDGSTENRTSPVDVQGLTDATDISTDFSHTLAVLNSGEIRSWGFGLIGSGRAKGENHVPVTLDGIDSAVRASIGYQHACAVLDGGGVSCWGVNDGGELGRGTVEDTTDGVEPGPVDGIDNAVDVVAGANHSCTLLSSGRVTCWGENGRGQIGNGVSDPAPDPEATPVEVPDVTNVVEMSAEEYHTCALTAGDEVWCWGLFTKANGEEVEKASPTQISL